MTRAIVLIGGLLSALLGGLITYATHSQATVAITPNIRTDACASGYQRITPNFCKKSTNSVEQWTLTATGCNLRTLTTIPSNATAVMLAVFLRVDSTGLAGTNTVDAIFYNNSGCTTAVDGVTLTVREQTAVAANTVLGEMNTYIVMRIINGQLPIQAFFTKTGSAALATFTIQGYYD